MGVCVCVRVSWNNILVESEGNDYIATFEYKIYLVFAVVNNIAQFESTLDFMRHPSLGCEASSPHIHSSRIIFIVSLSYTQL